MDVGVLTFPDAGFLDETRDAERHGFDFLGVADSQGLMHELHVSLGAAALATESIDLGPSVTNPVTRHPVVTASAMCTLDALSDGRAVLGVGSGDSAVYTLGETPAPLSEMREFVDLFRALRAGERVEYDGYEVGLTWLRERDRARDVPVLLTAEGPNTLRLAGEVADKVLVGTGATPEVVGEAVRRIDEGARDAGRDPDGIEKWAFARGAVVEDDLDEVADELKVTVAAAAHHTLQFTFEGKRVPEEYEEPIARLIEEYDSEQHVGLGDDPMKNARLVERLGLTDYLTERFCIAGTPEECVARIDRLDGLVDGVHFNPVHEDPREFMERMGEDVIPEL